MQCSCEVPGEVLVLPREGGPRQFSNLDRYEILYSAGTILNHYAEISGDQRIPAEAWGRLSRFPSQPFVIKVPQGEERRAALRFSADKRVQAAIPNVSIGLAGVTLSSQELDSAIQLHHAEAGAPICGSGVRVAVVDTGVDPALAPKCSVQYDIASPAASVLPQDSDGHGSVVAAIIGRIAPAATILSVKVFPNGTLGGLVIGIQIAMAVFEPHVLNLSLGIEAVQERCRKCGYPNGQQFSEALLRSFIASINLYKGNVLPLIVAAAGNNSRMLLPARCDSVLAVGAYDTVSQERPPYAQYPSVPSTRFVLAHGGDERRPLGTSGWGKPLFGTSFSAAIVSGCRVPRSSVATLSTSFVAVGSGKRAVPD
jgi:subtilisin family serine protease